MPDYDLFVLTDVTRFEFAKVTKGKVKILVPEEANAMKSRQRRYKLPHPPPIQINLKQAHQLKGYFVTTPSLTRTALAKKVGISPPYLTRLLNLLKLAPEIQRYIMGMPRSQTKGPITENRLKRIARMDDHGRQMKAFQEQFPISYQEGDTSRATGETGFHCGGNHRKEKTRPNCALAVKPRGVAGMLDKLNFLKSPAFLSDKAQ